MTSLLARILTRSFPGNRADLDDGSVSVVPETSEDEYESQAFTLWGSSLQDGEHKRILDLGPLRSSNLNYFAGRGCDLGVVGLEPERIPEQAERFETDGLYSGALCWDLPNYCDDEAAFEALGAWLAERLVSQAPVHLALATQAPYGDRPAHYEIVNDQRLKCESSTATGRRTQVFRNARLPKLWSQFEVQRSFLMRTGWQEHVLRRI